MTARLSEVSRELADRMLSEVDFENRLIGWSMRQMSGSQATSIYSLQEVADFIKISELDKLFSPGSGGSIGYVDIEELTEWIDGVLGDSELAGAIHETYTGTCSYAEEINKARPLIVQRLKQCEEMSGLATRRG